MDLWIRSQDKGLHQIIGINEPHIQSDCVVLIGYNQYKHIELGVYSTKERALEVLDEIQSIIDSGDNSYYSKEDDAYITFYGAYKMPKE